MSMKNSGIRGCGAAIAGTRDCSAHRTLGITALVGLIFGHNEPSLKLFQRLSFERWAFFTGGSANSMASSAIS